MTFLASACIAITFAPFIAAAIPIRERQPEPGITDARWAYLLADAKCRKAFHGSPASFEEKK